MVWWQIILIITGAIVVGVATALAIDHLIRRFRRRHATAPIQNNSGFEASSPVDRGISKPAASFTPLLSRRSTIILSIGLIIGASLGFGYWASIPSIDAALSNMRAGALLPFGTASETGPHESTITVQLVSPGSSYINLKDLQHKGEYYAAKANTLPFFQYLSSILATEGPQYSYTTDQLYQMIRIIYDYNSDTPALEIRVIGNSSGEAMFLTSSVPKVFQEFLVAEEEKLRQDEYENTLAEIETTRTILLEAQKKLGGMELQAVAEDLSGNPDYLALSATVGALKLQLNTEAVELASIVALGDTGQAYMDKLSAFRRTAEALAEAQRDIAILETQTTVNRLTENLDYQILRGKVDNLNADLASLSDKAISLSDPSVSEAEVMNYLAVGNPTAPVPVPPERMRLRNMLMLGALIGLAGAWLALNFRWLKKVLSPSGPSGTPEEDEQAWPQAAQAPGVNRQGSEVSGVAAGREKSMWDS
jgi:hypothetical protein